MNGGGGARVVGVLGGTGEQGRGLAHRLALAGHEILIGSRSADRAVEVATALGERVPQAEIVGAGNAEVAARADLVIAAVPYGGHRELLEGLAAQLSGKIVIDCVNPLAFDKSGAFGIDPPAGSAAQEAAEALPSSTVVGAFHHVSATLLLADGPLERNDVLVVGDDRDAKAQVIELVETIEGMRGLDGGRLRLCRQVEHMTAVLISINRRYKSHAGFLVTDV